MKEQYGDTSLWIRTYNANKKILGDNPSLLLAGLTLLMPAISMYAIRAWARALEATPSPARCRRCITAARRVRAFSTCICIDIREKRE